MKGIAWMLNVCVALALAAPAGANVPTGTGVVLNEIVADPAQDWNGDGTVSSRDDEWIEITNVGPGTIDLNGFRISSSDTTWRYEFQGEIAEGGHLVVTGKMSYDWERATAWPAYGLRLPNDGDTVLLWRVAEGDTVLVDSVTYSDEDAEDDRSLGRFPDGTGGWSLFDALDPVTPGGEVTGNGCAPTPGEMNSCGSPTEAQTWGRVKERFVSE